MLRYVILEKTPFPGHWVKTATCRIQEAELNSFPQTGHCRAMRWGTWNDRILLYTWDDAQTLMTYLRNTRPYADYQLMAVMTQQEEYSLEYNSN